MSETLPKLHKDPQNVFEVAEDYLAERASLKYSTLRGYREVLKNYLLPSFGKMEVSDITEELEQLKDRDTANLDGYVFTTKNGQPIDKHLDHVWRTALRKAGLRHRPSYQLRHTFASLCLQSGVAPEWLANVLRHSTLQTTFKHYARFIKDTSRENETRMEQLLTPSQRRQAKA